MSAPQPAWLRVWASTGAATPAASVAVPLTNREHVGIIFRDDDDQAHLLHLASHRRLCCDDALEGHAWVAPAIAPELLPSIAAMCARVVKRNAMGIPYGFRYDASRFASDGQLVLGNDEHGLTCATFVLAVLRSAGVELLKREEWPSRPDDMVRFAKILKALRSASAEDAYFDAIEAEVTAVRFRPTEVAGASAGQPPCSFADAVAAAAAIEGFLAAQAP